MDVHILLICMHVGIGWHIYCIQMEYFDSIERDACLMLMSNIPIVYIVNHGA